MFTGINWSDEIFKIKNVHMALLAVPGETDFLCFSNSASSSMAFRPKGVAAHPSPRKFDCVKVGLKISLTFFRFID